MAREHPRLEDGRSSYGGLACSATGQIHATARRRAFVEAKNQGDALVDQVQKGLAELGDALSARDKADAEAAIAVARSAMAGTNHESLKQAIERLNQAAAAISEAGRKAQAGTGAGHGAPGAGPSAGRLDEKVVDAEFEEVG